jgi:hypothetical protein
VVEAGPPNSLRRRAAKKPELFSIAGFTAAENSLNKGHGFTTCGKTPAFEGYELQLVRKCLQTDPALDGMISSMFSDFFRNLFGRAVNTICETRL